MLVHDLLDELPLRVVRRVADLRSALGEHLFVTRVLEGAVADVPRLEHRHPHIARQEAQEVQLPFDAQVVHVAADVHLVGDVTEDVEAGDEVVVDPLELRVVDHPQGLRGACRARPCGPTRCRNGGRWSARGRRRLLALPDRVDPEPLRNMPVVELGLRPVEAGVAVAVLVAEGLERDGVAAHLGGHAQVLLLLDQEIRELHGEVCSRDRGTPPRSDRR